MPGALEGIRVIDFTWVAAGPLCTKYFGDHGAEVIKVESRTHPDISRLTAPCKDQIADGDHSGMFICVNSSKYSLAVDLNTSKGRAIIKRLIACSDVVVENFTPGQINKWGFDYKELKKIKPDIIMLSLSIYGQTGPSSKLPGYGGYASAAIGLYAITGWPDRVPPAHLIPYPDFVIPWFGAVAVLTALDYRRRTGKGQYIDMSQVETTAHFLAPQVMDSAVNGTELKRRGNRSTSAAPHGVYRCKGDDRWCAIVVSNDAEWQAFCQVVGDTRLIESPRFTDILSRKENEDELDRLVEEWTMNLSPEEVMQIMQKAGIASGVVETSEDIVDKDPQLKYRQTFLALEHPALGTCNHWSWPAKLSKTPAVVRRAPLLGEHNEYICAKVLDMSDKEFIELVNGGILQ
jgi:benzylsuccinate CoA-transferase BbsF subunit